MKKAFLHIALFFVLNLHFVIPASANTSTTNFDHEYHTYTALLKENVTQGLVNYKAIKASPNKLNSILTNWGKITKTQFASWSQPQQISFLFNLYNASTLKLIADNYPVESIKDIGSFFSGPWDQKMVILFGTKTTLDHVEHEILRKQYNEPKLHLTLVCAAMGCPPLRNDAYTANSLEAQFSGQAKQLLDHPLKFKLDRINNTVYLSAIFKWYGDDFIKSYLPQKNIPGLSDKEASVVNYLASHLPKPDQDYLNKGDYDIEYLDYDWSLNEQ